MLSGLGELLKAQNGETNKEEEFKKKIDKTSKIMGAIMHKNKGDGKPRKLSMEEIARIAISNKD